jgi:hypothetical protein
VDTGCPALIPDIFPRKTESNKTKPPGLKEEESLAPLGTAKKGVPNVEEEEPVSPDGM